MAPKPKTRIFRRRGSYEISANNTVEVSPGWHLKQVCYYHGELITNPPENLINVLLDDITIFFHHATEKTYTSRSS